MAQPLDNLTRTWTSGATESGIKLSVTDPGAAAASNLLELRGGAAGTTSLFSVSKAGVALADNLATITGGSGYGFRWVSGLGVGYFYGGALAIGLDYGKIQLGSGGAVGWSSSLTPGTAPDLILLRDAANTLAQRNSTNPQAFRIYNTFTDTLNNFERGKIAWESNVLRIGTEKGLTAGTARALELQTDGVTRLTIGATGVATFTNQVITTFVVAPSGVLFGASSSQVGAPSNGVIRLSNAAVDDFNRLQFGGTSSSFPAIKRDTVRLQARLADDSAFTNIQGKLTADVNAVAETPTATHTITIYDAAGTGYKVLCVAA